MTFILLLLLLLLLLLFTQNYSLQEVRAFPGLMGFLHWFLDRMGIKCILDTQTIPFTRNVNGGNWSFIPKTDGFWQFVPDPDVNPKMSEEMPKDEEEEEEEEGEMGHIYNSEASSIKIFII